MYVCICNNVTEGDIRKAIEDGHVCLKDIKVHLKIETCCGKCTANMKEVIEKEREFVQRQEELSP